MTWFVLTAPKGTECFPHEYEGDGDTVACVRRATDAGRAVVEAYEESISCDDLTRADILARRAVQR